MVGEEWVNVLQIFQQGDIILSKSLHANLQSNNLFNQPKIVFYILSQPINQGCPLPQKALANANLINMAWF